MEILELYGLPFEKLSKKISDLLIEIFEGDCDQIQAWLEAPNKHLDEVQPLVWWQGGKAPELLVYLEGVRARYRRQPDGRFGPRGL